MWGQEWKWETSEKTILEVQTGDGGVEVWRSGLGTENISEATAHLMDWS